MSFARFLFLFAMVVGSTAVGLAADKPGSPLAVYDQFPQAYRPFLKRGYAEEMKRRNKAVGEAKATVAKFKDGPNHDAAEERLEAAKKSVDELKINNPPFAGMHLTATHPQTSWRVGDIGIESEEFIIFQVVDKTSAIIKCGPFNQDVVAVEGIDTEGWKDGEMGSLHAPIWISGTTTYANASGGSNTVLRAEKFDWVKYQKWLKNKGVK